MDTLGELFEECAFTEKDKEEIIKSLDFPENAPAEEFDIEFIIRELRLKNRMDLVFSILNTILNENNKKVFINNCFNLIAPLTINMPRLYDIRRNRDEDTSKLYYYISKMYFMQTYTYDKLKWYLMGREMVNIFDCVAKKTSPEVKETYLNVIIDYAIFLISC